MHPLDRPVWSALSTTHAALSVGTANARRYPGEIGPLAACRDDSPESLGELADLVASEGAIVLLQVGIPPIPAGSRADLVADGVQMLLQDSARLVDPGDVDALGDADAAEMQALAQLTAPGPFSTRTHTLGRFYGIRIDGRLAAMAGERTRCPGHTEVSGVCTHPDFRGRGLAAKLCSKVAGGILARGDLAYLHAYATNTPAIRLYEQLGFVIRTAVTVVKLVKA